MARRPIRVAPDAPGSDADLVAEALAAPDPEPEAAPPSHGERVLFRVGGWDEAPEMREAEVVSVSGRGVGVLVLLDGQHDSGVDDEVRARGIPARSGEALVFRGVIEGAAVGRWSRPA